EAGAGAGGDDMGTEPGNGNVHTGTGLGSVAVTGASMGSTFTPGGHPTSNVDVTQIGPDCSATGNCTSILSITWGEYDYAAGRVRSLGVMLYSNTTSGSGNPPGVGVT